MSVTQLHRLNGFWLVRPDGSKAWPWKYFKAKISQAAGSGKMDNGMVSCFFELGMINWMVYCCVIVFEWWFHPLKSKSGRVKRTNIGILQAKSWSPLSLVHIPRFWSEFCQAPEAELLALRRDSMDVVDAVDERWGVGWCMGRAPFSNSRQFPSSNANGDEDIW